MSAAVRAGSPLVPMKTLCALLALLALNVVAASAQDATAAAAPAPARRSPEELEKLLAPIALYPDALIAIILPAATAPADVVLAARHVRDNPGDTSQIEHRAWDESVKSLTHYPAVLAWMDENLDWTKQLGEAFVEQPAEVMQAMQRLRAQARAAGTLVDTPQQQVIAEANVIRIVPAQPDVIYVPYYEPEVVFVTRPHYGYVSPRPFFSFGVGVAVGSWLAFECDWNRHTIWVGNRHRPWTHHDWRRPLVVAPPIGAAYVRTPEVRHWRPSPQTVRPNFRPAPRPSTPVAVVKPQPFAPIERRAGLPTRAVRPTDLDSRHGELSPNAIARRPRPEQAKEKERTSTSTVVAPPLATQTALAPTVPPPMPAAKPDRSRENRERGQPPRSSPPTVVQAPGSNASPAPTPAPSAGPDRSRDYTRRSHAPAAPQNRPAEAATVRRAPPSVPDYRGHSRSAPAVAPAAPPTPPANPPAASAPAPSSSSTQPNSSPPRQDRRGGRSGDPER